MEKETKEILEELKDIMKDLLNGNRDSMINKIEERITKGFKEHAKISIEKFEDGRASTNIEGTTMGILIALAGLEKTILEKTNPPKELWELIKKSVGTMEVK
ncbi:hypothetical protein IJE86_01460 [bacterium]|nr:hypothetical protein [bacterium]